MFNDTEKSKLNRFINDPVMSSVVREVIDNEITKPTKDRDVQSLAARFLAIEILRDAYKELDKYKDIQEVEQNKVINYV